MIKVKTPAVQLTFPEWFKIMRGRSGLSQAAIAQKIGVKPQTVSNWERGESIPSLDPDQTLKLCVLLDTDLQTFAKAFRGEIDRD